MAITKTPESSRLDIKVQTGINNSGQPVYKMRSFKGVKPAATDENVYAVGEGLAKLQKHKLITVNRVDLFAFSN